MTGKTSRWRAGGLGRSDGPFPLARRCRTEVRPRLALGKVWWLAFAVLAGLFAMHGLGAHGVHSSEASTAMHQANSHGAPMPASEHLQGAAATSDDRLHAPSASEAEGTPGPSGGAGLLGLCLTVLAFGVLWLRRSSGFHHAWTWSRHALDPRPTSLRVTARSLSPPLRAELSIWRC